MARVGESEKARGLARTVVREAWYGLSGLLGETVLRLAALTHGEQAVLDACRLARLGRDLGRPFSWGELRAIVAHLPFAMSSRDLAAGLES